jgi:hypothetical protein
VLKNQVAFINKFIEQVRNLSTAPASQDVAKSMKKNLFPYNYNKKV